MPCQSSRTTSPSDPGGTAAACSSSTCEDVKVPSLGLGLLGPGEVAAIPVENRAGRGLAGFERVQPLDGRVGIAAGCPRAEDALARLGEMARARADDHRHVAVPRRPQAEHAEVGVDPPLRDGNPSSQSQFARRPAAQLRLAVAQRHDPRGPFLEQVGQADGLQQPDRPAAVRSGVVPFDRDVIQRQGPLAGQAIHHPVGAFDDPLRHGRRHPARFA